MNTPEGKAAKRFVQALVDRAKAVVVTTTKPDKYDRYLADVFLEGDFSQIPTAGAQLGDEAVFLNNLLLENGHADPMEAAEFSEGEKILG